MSMLMGSGLTTETLMVTGPDLVGTDRWRLMVDRLRAVSEVREFHADEGMPLPATAPSLATRVVVAHGAAAGRTAAWCARTVGVSCLILVEPPHATAPVAAVLDSPVVTLAPRGSHVAAASWRPLTSGPFEVRLLPSGPESDPVLAWHLEGLVAPWTADRQHWPAELNPGGPA
jgi:hypothetical protein